MHFPTPLRLATFAVSILLRAVLVNHVAAWLQTQGVENTIRAVFMRPSADAPRATGGFVDSRHWVEQVAQRARGGDVHQVRVSGETALPDTSVVHSSQAKPARSCGDRLTSNVMQIGGLKFLHPCSPLLLAFALLASCDANRQARGEPGGPLEAAVKFHEVNAAGRCDEVWRFYTAGTQENIRAWVHRNEREREAAPQPEEPQRKDCQAPNRYPALKRGTVRIVRVQGDEAVVAADFSGEALTRRFDLFPPTKVWTEELRLVREAGEWRVERPRLPIENRPGSRLIEVGPVDVFQGVRVTGLHQSLEATAVLRTPREALERALRDPTLWARVLPSVSAVESVERTGKLERMQLSFAEPARSLTVEVRPLDPTMATPSLLWSVEGDMKAPVYIRGRWDLHPYPDGTRVTLKLTIDPKHWPSDAADGVFSAQRMAQAVLDLEQAALK